jgi:ubiquinol-cytochrome c reductase cytochrome b subunit
MTIQGRRQAQVRRLGAVLRRDRDDRWAAMFGQLAGYSFVVAVITGILLLPFFHPSMATVVYHGPYAKLDGVPVSRAFRSVLAISFQVRGGLLVRQVHHWSADVFVAAICLRLVRVFTRGRWSGLALRRWLIWVTLLPVGMLTAYSGTILPDDGLSGGSLGVITGVLLSVPMIGTHLVWWVFGGSPPGHLVIGRAYWVHIVVLPALTGALLLLSFRPPLRRPRRLRWPGLGWVRRVRVNPLLPLTCGVLVLLGTVAQINPVWLIGPDQPGSISAGAVPDWYMGFLDGPLRLMPAWEVPVAGHRLALDVLVPGLLLPFLFFTGLAVYPVVDRRFGNRAAAGAAGITFYGLLLAAASNDQIAYHLQVPLYVVTWTFRVAVLAGPVAAFVITRIAGQAMAARRRDEQQHGRETGRIVMNPRGGYTEIHETVHRAALPTADPPAPGSDRDVRVDS